MKPDKVYSDNFILDCANLLKVENNRSLQLIRNKLKSKELQLGIFNFDRFLDTIRPLKYGNEIEKNFHDKILAWAADSKIKDFNFPSLDLPKKRKPSPSSIWFETEEYEYEMVPFLNENGILSLIKEDIEENHYEWLFKVTELPTIHFDTRFIWNDYLENYSHYTDKICIWDRYFYYSWSEKIETLIGCFLELNPKLKIEIVGELDAKNGSYEYGLKHTEFLSKELQSQIKLFKADKNTFKRHHDRYLLTKYCMLKSEPGFAMTKNKKSIRETTPTLIGRYATDNHKWRSEFEDWNKRRDELCEPITV